jgi:peptidoglycan hydrolase-like protein with peptidoglycan-binding domain
MEEKEEYAAVEEESVKTDLPAEAEVLEVEVVEKEAATTQQSKRDKVAPQPPARRQRSAVATSIQPETYVSLGAMVYLAVARNSRSVAAVQTRLLELGFVEAGGEHHGWFGPLTMAALRKFQEQAGLEAEEPVSTAVLEALFDGTPAEVLP